MGFGRQLIYSGRLKGVVVILKTRLCLGVVCGGLRRAGWLEGLCLKPIGRTNYKWTAAIINNSRSFDERPGW